LEEKKQEKKKGQTWDKKDHRWRTCKNYIGKEKLNPCLPKRTSEGHRQKMELGSRSSHPGAKGGKVQEASLDGSCKVLRVSAAEGESNISPILNLKRANNNTVGRERDVPQKKEVEVREGRETRPNNALKGHETEGPVT